MQKSPSLEYGSLDVKLCSRFENRFMETPSKSPPPNFSPAKLESKPYNFRNGTLLLLLFFVQRRSSIIKTKTGRSQRMPSLINHHHNYGSSRVALGCFYCNFHSIYIHADFHVTKSGSSSILYMAASSAAGDLSMPVSIAVSTSSMPDTSLSNDVHTYFF